MDDNLGTRIAGLRRQRSLTQAELAAQAGLSLTTITKAEQGSRHSVSMSTLSALARVFEVRTSDLLTSPVSMDRDDNGDTADLIALRRVLVPVPGMGATVEAPTLTDLRRDLLTITAAYQDDRYSEALSGISSQLLAADAAADSGEPMALKLQSRSYLMASLILLQFRREDLSYEASRRAMVAAQIVGDPLLEASGADTIGWVFQRQARLEDAEDTARIMAERIEPAGDVSEVHLAVYGRLLTRASSSAARNNKPDVARDYMAEARKVANRMGRDHMTMSSFWAGFGPTTVNTIEVENAMVMGEPDRALFLGRRVSRSPAIRETTWQRYLLTVAEALMATKQMPNAASALVAVHDAAPEWFKHQRLARRLVREMQDASSVRWARSHGITKLAEAVG